MNNLVSICIPTLNGEKYIAEAVFSALSQTYRPLEIIVSDDNSSDKTLSIISKIKNETDIPIKIYSHIPNGIGSNWSNCINLAKGEYIKFLFQDDLLTSDCIEEMIKPFKLYKNVGLSFCKREFIVETDDPERLNWMKQFDNLDNNWINLKPVQKGKALLRDPNLLSTPMNKVGEPTSVLLKKDVFKKVGYFNEDLKQILDYECWYRVFSKYNVAFIDKKLNYFRLHPNQTTVENSKEPIKDYYLYPNLLYRNLFWYLHPKLKYDLFFQYNKVGRVLNRILKKLNIKKID